MSGADMSAPKGLSPQAQAQSDKTRAKPATERSDRRGAEWITQYREALGLDTLQFARALSALGAKQREKLRVSENLLLILEGRRGAVTHPLIANLIARACGATPEQRDGIVHPKHRGRWHGVDAPALDAKTANPWRTAPAVAMKRKNANPLRSVVAVDRWGTVLRVFQTVRMAADQTGYSKSGIVERCNRRVYCEFKDGKRETFRFADDWLAKTPQERAAEMAKVAKRKDERDISTCKPVVVVDGDGNELRRWHSLYAAEKGEGMTAKKVRDRCMRRTVQEFADAQDVTYRYAEEWDAMTREQQIRDIAAARGEVKA